MQLRKINHLSYRNVYIFQHLQEITNLLQTGTIWLGVKKCIATAPS